jgi:hypothetical protein
MPTAVPVVLVGSGRPVIPVAVVVGQVVTAAYSLLLPRA